VRFGSVLGSRGSVVLTVRRQIEAGGPVTLTHSEMMHYFMIIPEAVSLVLQAGAMADSNVLEMGRPVKILELARKMIELKDVEGDVEEKYVGLRPGEAARGALRGGRSLRPDRLPGDLLPRAKEPASPDLLGVAEEITHCSR
jgi:FlaA1/EpsC-like NDP-sugar epimerase